MKNISWGCVGRRWKNKCAAWVFLTPCDTSQLDIFHIKNKQLIFLFIIYLINIIFNFSIYKCLMKKEVVPKLQQEVKLKVDIVTSGDIKIYYTTKFQNFTARYIIKQVTTFFIISLHVFERFPFGIIEYSAGSIQYEICSLVTHHLIWKKRFNDFAMLCYNIDQWSNWNHTIFHSPVLTISSCMFA